MSWLSPRSASPTRGRLPMKRPPVRPQVASVCCYPYHHAKNSARPPFANMLGSGVGQGEERLPPLGQGGLGRWVTTGIGHRPGRFPPRCRPGPRGPGAHLVGSASTTPVVRRRKSRSRPATLIPFNSYIRRDKDRNQFVVIVCNFTPAVRRNYRIGVPREGNYRERVNTDSEGVCRQRCGKSRWQRC
jgi:hypothetical protein